MKRLRPIALRLWPKVAKVGHGTCWIWMGYRNKWGYGEIGRGRRGMGNAAVHVVAYEDLVGPVPDGLTLDHFRMNPGPRHAPCSRACVNPAHLEPVTFRENILRGMSMAARYARRTHCPCGRPYDRLRKSGARSCTVCDKAYSARYYKANASHILVVLAAQREEKRCARS